LVARMLPNADPVHKISIVSRGMALGYTKQVPLEDRYLISRSQINDMLAHMLGGRTAEELIFDEITTGASDDIKRATSLARRMVIDFGMSDKLGPRTFGHKEEMVFLGREISEQKDYGDKVADTIDSEVNKLIQNARETARKILTENKDKLIELTNKLIEQETLEGEALEKVFEGLSLPTTKKKPRKTKTPAPVKPEAEVVPSPTPKKVPGVPRLVPKQTPAGTD
jgi:cell division protease FtsH